MLARVIVKAITATALFALSGCLGLELVIISGIAPLAGGAMPDSHSVTFDQATATPKLQQVLASAHTITSITNGGDDRSNIYMAEYLEEKNAYEVKTEDIPGGATPSQRRKLMRQICSRRDKPDLVISSTMGNMGTGTPLLVSAMVTGRRKSDVSFVMSFLRCRDNWQGKVNGKVEIDRGAINSNFDKEINQIMGYEAAKALMRLAGKLPPDIPDIESNKNGPLEWLRSLSPTSPTASSGLRP